MHKTFAILALPLAVAASELEAQPVGFQAVGAVSTSLSECMEALEHGTPVPALSDEIGGKPVSFVVYDANFFGFLFDDSAEGISRCVKVPASEKPIEQLSETEQTEQRDLLPPAPAD